MKALLKSGEVPENYASHIHVGGDLSNPSWDEYLAGFKDSARPYIEAIRECIIEHGLVGKKGGEMANDWFFQFDEEKTVFAFSWRAWGDLMQAIVNKREGYMAYYM